jgi:hypothetical protein
MEWGVKLGVCLSDGEFMFKVRPTKKLLASAGPCGPSQIRHRSYDGIVATACKSQLLFQLRLLAMTPCNGELFSSQ